MKKIISNNCPN